MKSEDCGEKIFNTTREAVRGTIGRDSRVDDAIYGVVGDVDKVLYAPTFDGEKGDQYEI